MTKSGKEIYKELLREVKEKARFEEIIYHLTEENFEEAKALLPKYDPYYVQNLIYDEPGIFNFKLKADLFALTGKLLIRVQSFRAFVIYLYLRGIIPEEVFKKQPVKEEDIESIEYYENPIKENTFAWIIWKDDQEKFAKFIAEKNVDVYEQIDFEINGQPYGIDLVKYFLDTALEEGNYSSTVLTQFERTREFYYSETDEVYSNYRNGYQTPSMRLISIDDNRYDTVADTVLPSAGDAAYIIWE